MGKLFIKLTGLLILFLLLKNIRFSAVFSNIKNCDLVYLGAALFAQGGVVLVKALRWRYILNLLRIKVDFWPCLKAFWSGLYFAAITPGKVGDISRVYFLGNNHSLARSIFSVILDRLLDIISLVILGLAVCFFYLKEMRLLSGILLVFLAVIMLLLWLVFAKRYFFYELFKTLIYKFIPKDRFPLGNKANLDLLKEISVGKYLLVLIYILAGWAVYFLGWWFLAKGLHIGISFLNMVGAVSIATIVSLLPISISGVGTRDAAIVLIFSKIGIAQPLALSFSLMIFIIEISIVCLGIIFFLQGRNKVYVAANA